MPTVQQQREKLIGLLKQLFQLDQPELDFGFYRIMHAKAKEVNRFLEDDLLKIITDAFGELSGQQVYGRLERARQRVVDQLGPSALAKDGSLTGLFTETPAGKEYLTALELARAAADTTTAEGEVYDHLYRFFERYYEGGDFISKRYLTRETSGRAAPYAVPYNGEEVKLHWANSDQYYIKTAEYFTNFTFKLRPDHARNPLPVNFRAVDATEGEHGNVKESNGQKRYFILHSEDPVCVENGELVVRFEYRPDPEKTGQDGVWQGKRNEESEKAILAALEDIEEAREYLDALRQPAPTNGQKDRTLLGKYIAKYSARNTMDYFIHKDLGGFLRRELDFYIKNEVMRLDDIESAEAPRVERYLNKIKVLRKIAGKLIEFLAQLEDFQKKLWLKKKFVVDTQYCITLGCVPEEFYPVIAANDAQREEWVRLFAIDEIKATLETPAYSNPLTVEFLRSNRHLLLDTSLFSADFKDRLLASFYHVEQQTDGLVVHGENYQALQLLLARFRSCVKSLYIDPPYNTDASEILYKNNYKDSSWLSLIDTRITIANAFLSTDAVACVTIDDFEHDKLRFLLDRIYGTDNLLGTAVIRNNPQGRSTVKGFAVNHEFGLFYAAGTNGNGVGRLERSEKQIARYDELDKEGRQFVWDNFRKTGTDSNRADRPKQFYPIYYSEKGLRIPKMEWDANENKWIVLEQPNADEEVLFPVNDLGVEKVWKWGSERVSQNPQSIRLNQSTRQIEVQNYLNILGSLPGTWWDKPRYAAGSHGTNLLTNLFGVGHQFPFPKSVFAVEDCLKVCGLQDDKDGFALDYFSGSGTTGHAVINLNREDGGRRKFILVEMGGYFDTVLLPRLKKVTFTPEWKDGKPKRLATVEEAERSPRIMKVIRLESYEDTLNNLEFKDDEARLQLLEQNSGLRQDFMLHYMLDVETKGSQSLLNIDAFADPTAYKLKVKKPGSDEYEVRNVDLLETFNYLIGLRVEHIAAPQSFTATFKREPDPELPSDSNTKLTVDGRIKQDANGPWWFRTVEGWVPDGNGGRENVLIVWRNLTEDIEKDNLMLDEWFTKLFEGTRNQDYDTIYVNGTNNLPNVRRDTDNWKVRLIEEDFFRLMWDVEDV